MGLNPNYIEGQTPLDEEELQELKIRSISNKKELDEFEQMNIEQAMQWVLVRNFSKDQILTIPFVCNLHMRMFGEVWQWAGKFRRTQKNLGSNYWQISFMLSELLNDVYYWIENQSYPAEEIAIRFKHRIVSIHCFSNGNGRHSRLLADLVISKIYKKPYFTWGLKAKLPNARKLYLFALKEADKGNMIPLIEFAAS